MTRGPRESADHLPDLHAPHTVSGRVVVADPRLARAACAAHAVTERSVRAEGLVAAARGAGDSAANCTPSAPSATPYALRLYAVAGVKLVFHRVEKIGLF